MTSTPHLDGIQTVELAADAALDEQVDAAAGAGAALVEQVDNSAAAAAAMVEQGPAANRRTPIFL